MWVNPYMGSLLVRIGMIMLVMFLIPLPFMSLDSPSFVPWLLSLLAIAIFISLVIWDVKRETR